MRQLRDVQLGDVAEASVYGTLRRLYRAGLLTSHVVASDAGPHRKYYGPVGPRQPAPRAGTRGVGALHLSDDRPREDLRRDFDDDRDDIAQPCRAELSERGR
jgi:Transcriptional regulator PadR-like family